jgi:hypothetical protein
VTVHDELQGNSAEFVAITLLRDDPYCGPLAW